MGALASRQNAGIEEVDVVSNQAYKYPARSGSDFTTGNYFGSHFIMGGERFDTPQPEAYLFGENADLNFLGSRPTPFPYPPPQANEPTKALKSVVNIRKESLRFVRCPDAIKGVDKGEAGSISTQFNIEFTFDCDARCAITIYYFCSEEITANGVIYTPRDPSMNSETYHYKRGANQQFSQVSHIFNPSQYSDEELVYNPEREVIPIAIYCVAEEGPEEPKQSHTTIAVVDHHSDGTSDGTYVLKALKQKLFVDGLCYLVQEIYGIENKNIDNAKATGDDDAEDNGSECVICMSDVRDTLILPCRHLCLCNSCADSLRYQANNCPICRAPFRALLQIKTLQKCAATSNGVTPPSNLPGEGPCDHIPPGYEAVSLIEALNGPCTVRPVTVIAPQELAVPETPDQEETPQSAACFTRTSLERTPKRNKHLGSPDECCDSPKGASWERNERDRGDSRDNRSCPTPEYRMSVLLAREKEGMKLQTKSPLLVRHGVKPANRDKSSLRHRDTVKLVNEIASLAAQASIASQDTDECQDDDSEAEKLSPLLDAATSTDPLPLEAAGCNTLQSGTVDTLVDTVDIDEVDDLLDEEQYNQRNVSSPAPATHGVRNNLSGNTETTLAVGEEDSDYFTPEDAPTSGIGPLHADKQDRGLPPVSCSTVPSSVESTPGRWIPSRDAHLTGLTSLPGTPLSSASHFSNRSSNDSYSSSSSTRQLLASGDVATPNQERAVQL